MSLQVVLVTPTRALAKLKVDMVVAPSVMGQLGILPNHRPLLAALGVGIVELRSGTGSQRFAISDGFLEVENDQVRILPETAEAASDIDVARAEAALKDAEAQLKKLDSQSAEYADQMGRAERARNRLALVAKS